MKKERDIVDDIPFLKVPTGFEPVHGGFADLSLTTWVRHHCITEDIRKVDEVQARPEAS